MKTSVFVITLMLASAFAFVPAKASAENGKVWEIDATKEQTFVVKGEKKPVITAKPGEQLTLRITAHKGTAAAKDGAVHGFVIKSLADQGWNVRLKEGTQEVTLKAPDKPGEYIIECNVPCGPSHGDQKMKLIVTP